MEERLTGNLERGLLYIGVGPGLPHRYRRVGPLQPPVSQHVSWLAGEEPTIELWEEVEKRLDLNALPDKIVVDHGSPGSVANVEWIGPYEYERWPVQKGDKLVVKSDGKVVEAVVPERGGLVQVKDKVGGNQQVSVYDLSFPLD